MDDTVYILYKVILLLNFVNTSKSFNLALNIVQAMLLFAIIIIIVGIS